MKILKYFLKKRLIFLGWGAGGLEYVWVKKMIFLFQNFILNFFGGWGEGGE